jgi:hypothetical protein
VRFSRVHRWPRKSRPSPPWLWGFPRKIMPGNYW